MTYEQADAILTSCTHTDREDYRISEIRSHGKTIQACCECWNAHVKARKLARKAQLDADKVNRLRCCRCGLKPYTIRLANFPLCGGCAKTARADHERGLANAGALAIFAGAQLLADTTSWHFAKYGGLREWFECEVAKNPQTTL